MLTGHNYDTHEIKVEKTTPATIRCRATKSSPKKNFYWKILLGF
jgi:hypothetical protein